MDSISNAINSPMAPTLVLLTESYLISSIFMSTFNIAATTILQCFLIDIELGKDRVN